MRVWGVNSPQQSWKAYRPWGGSSLLGIPNGEYLERWWNGRHDESYLLQEAELVLGGGGTLDLSPLRMWQRKLRRRWVSGFRAALWLASLPPPLPGGIVGFPTIRHLRSSNGEEWLREKGEQKSRAETPVQTEPFLYPRVLYVGPPNKQFLHFFFLSNLI